MIEKRNNKKMFIVLVGLFALIMALMSMTLYFAMANDSEEQIKDEIFCLVNDKVIVPNYIASPKNATAFDPDGKEITITTNNGVARFFPSKVGTYKIRYTDGKSTSVRVFKTVPTNNFLLSSEFSASYGVGKKLTLPHATISSAAKTYSEYLIEISCDGAIVKTIKVSDTEPIIYDLEKKGAYEVCYKIVDVFNADATKKVNFVCNGALELNCKEVPDFLEYGQAYNFENPTLVKDGKTQKATISIQQPDGESVVVTDSKFTPTKYGDYIATITGSVGAETKTYTKAFRVVVSPASMFVASKGISEVKSNVPYPAYAYKGEGITGVGITAESSGSSVELKNPLDLSKLSATDSIISFQAISKKGYQNIKQMQIVLTDIYDDNNFIKVNISAHVTALYDAYVKAMVKGSGFTGIGSPDYGAEGWVYSPQYGDQSGAMMSHGSFCGSRLSETDNQNKALDFNFRLDLETKQLWMVARDMTRFSGHESEGIISHMILDLDNPLHVGKGKEWKGFTTNEVKIKVVFADVIGKSGIIIKSIGDYSFGGESMADTEAPLLSFDTDASMFDEADPPYGVVNKAYKLPTMISNDFVCGKSKVLPKVYKKAGDTLQTISNDIFTPTSAGEYYLKYEAEDLFGNSASKIVNIDVLQTVNTPTYKFEPSLSNLAINSIFSVPNVEIVGASGNPVPVKKLVYAGEEIIIDEQVPAIFLSKKGEIVYTQTWVDYLGLEYVKTYRILVTVNGRFIQVDGAPMVAEAGQKIVIPDFLAIDGAKEPTDAGYNLIKKICVEDSAGVHELPPSREYTAPATAQEATIKYYVGAETTPAVTKVLNILKINDGGNEITKYFQTDGNVTITANDNNVTFETRENDTDIKMPYPIVTENLIMNFSLTKENAKGYVDVRFTDLSNEYLTMFFRFYGSSDGKTSKMKVNGVGDDYFVALANGKFDLIFDSRNKTLYANNGIVISSVKTYENGTQFLGFSNGIATMSYQLGNVTTSAKFILEKVSNQMFNNTVTTTYRNNGGSGPCIRYETPILSARVDIGSKYCLSAAWGYDVLTSAPSAVTVTVKLSTGTENKTILNNVLCTTSTELLLDEYGYYTITYKAINKFNAPFTQYVSVNVIDKVAPEMVVNGEIASEYKLGDSITLPTMTVKDNRPDYVNNVTSKYIFVVKEMYRQYYVEGDKVTFNAKGSYQILYIAYDAASNKTIKIFNVVVK